MSPVLLGGRKPMKAKIVRGKCIGRGGLEGEIFATTVIIKKRGRTRAVQLAEKQFLKGSPKGGLRNPSKQFKIMTELKRLNSEKSWACIFYQRFG